MIQFKEAKIERSMRREELAAFLRELAETLEGEAHPRLDEFRRLSMSLKVDGDQAYARIKLKHPYTPTAGVETTAQEPEGKPADTPRPDPLPDYTGLKKDMKGTFKIIFKSVHEGELPPEEVVRRFVDDAHTMTRFPGKGDDYYDEFNEAADELLDALGTGDVARLHEACDRLNHIKTECHARHK